MQPMKPVKHLIAALCLVLGAGPAVAADMSEKKAPATEKSAKKEPSAKQKAQQDKMRTCSKEAKDKNMKGDDRKKFMSECMKG